METKWWVGGVLLLVVGFILAAMWAITEFRQLLTDIRVRESDDLHTVTVICTSAMEAAEKSLVESREDIRALTEALGRANNTHVVYPRKGPIETSEGWFDGKPRITKASPLVAADASIQQSRDANRPGKEGKY